LIADSNHQTPDRAKLNLHFYTLFYACLINFFVSYILVWFGSVYTILGKAMDVQLDKS
jgi:hypothetical protein